MCGRRLSRLGGCDLTTEPQKIGAPAAIYVGRVLQENLICPLPLPPLQVPG